MKQEMMTIVSQVQLAPLIYALTLTGDLVNEMHSPGQFLHIRVPRSDLLLRRPISLNAIDHSKKECRIIYRIEGVGTKVLSEMQKGDRLDVLGPLGNGFSIADIPKGATAFIIGGGIGIPPLYELSKQLRQKGVKTVHFLGFTTSTTMYAVTDFEELGPTLVATDDGSFGKCGNVGNLLLSFEQVPDVVFACGNTGLLKTTEQFYAEKVANVQLSLEARMACGIGACYACVCHVKDDASGIKSVKICDEGPIFKAGEVSL